MNVSAFWTNLAHFWGVITPRPSQAGAGLAYKTKDGRPDPCPPQPDVNNSLESHAISASRAIIQTLYMKNKPKSGSFVENREQCFDIALNRALSDNNVSW